MRFRTDSVIVSLLSLAAAKVRGEVCLYSCDEGAIIDR